jgi:hypothetical protein
MAERGSAGETFSGKPGYSECGWAFDNAGQSRSGIPASLRTRCCNTSRLVTALPDDSVARTLLRVRVDLRKLLFDLCCQPVTRPRLNPVNGGSAQYIDGDLVKAALLFIVRTVTDQILTMQFLADLLDGLL